jgi:hypothetical protein
MFRGRYQEMANLRRQLKGTQAFGNSSTDGSPFSDRLNNDTVGFPQNEESIDVCHSDTNNVIEGTNDYRSWTSRGSRSVIPGMASTSG